MKTFTEWASSSNFANYDLLNDRNLQKIDNLELLMHSKIEKLAKEGNIKDLMRLQIDILPSIERELNKAIQDIKTKGHGGYEGG